jgi:hypothetical protein
MLHELYKTDTLEKNGSIIITGDSPNRLLHYQGVFIVTVNNYGKTKRKTMVHYVPELSDEFLLVSLNRKEPLHGAVSLLESIRDQNPVGYVIKLGTHALIKSYNTLSHEVELHYYYRGMCVDTEVLDRNNIRDYVPYVSAPADQGYVPTCDPAIVDDINRRAARFYNLK